MSSCNSSNTVTSRCDNEEQSSTAEPAEPEGPMNLSSTSRSQKYRGCIMEGCRRPCLSLWLVAVVALGISRVDSQEGNTTQVNTTVIPPGNLTTFQTPGITSSTTLKTTTMIKQTQTNKDPTPLFGNSWKFTVCIAVLALCTCMLIVCGIKGPSWYKLFHNYRHRRLQEEDEDGVSTVYSKTERHLSTFTFQQDDEQMEEVEEQDEYFEDPYIKSDTHQQSNDENSDSN